MRIAILGNSGSGKSTLARSLAGHGVPVLDLDAIYWEPGQLAVERARDAILEDLSRFCGASADWIVQGCYGDLVERALAWEPELVLLDPGEEACVRNCLARPHEPHKYDSKEEQDERLAFLLEWVRDYYRRDGPMSLQGHRALFEGYAGPKRWIEGLPAEGSS